MEHKQDFLTAVPTAWPGSHPSPSLHPSLMEEGWEIPLHSLARVNGGLGPSATGILAGSRQLGSHSSLLLTVQELGKGRAGSSSGADFCSRAVPKHIPGIVGIFYLQDPQLLAQLTPILSKPNSRGPSRICNLHELQHLKEGGKLRGGGQNSLCIVLLDTDFLAFCHHQKFPLNISVLFVNVSNRQFYFLHFFARTCLCSCSSQTFAPLCDCTPKKI